MRENGVFIKLRFYLQKMRVLSTLSDQIVGETKNDLV